MEIRLEKRGKTWQYSFEGTKNELGKRTRIAKGGYKTKSAASEAGAKAYAEYSETGLQFETNHVTLREFVDFWIEQYCKLNLKKSAVDNYKKRLRYHILPALGHMRLTAINAAVLQKFINEKAQAQYSHNTLVVLKGILSGCFNFAVTQNVLKYNPMSSVKIPSARNNGLRLRKAPNHVISPEAFEKILARFPEGTTAYIPLQFGYRCGMRVGEAFAVTWDCVDFENKTIKIDKQVTWDETKSLWYLSKPKYDSERIIAIDDGLVEILRRARESQLRAKEYYGDNYSTNEVDAEGYINNDQPGHPIEFVSVRENGDYAAPRIMQHVASIVHYDLNIPEFTFHSLRHTHATMLAEAGVPIKYAQERLGHKEVEMTLRIYSHTTQKINEDSRQILNQMYQKQDNIDGII